MRTTMMITMMLMAPASLAQEDAREPQVVHAEVTKVDFDDPLGIEGTMWKPDGRYIGVFTPPAVQPWTPVREDFEREMVREATQQR